MSPKPGNSPKKLLINPSTGCHFKGVRKEKKILIQAKVLVPLYQFGFTATYILNK